MANYESVTVSEGGEIINKKEVEKIINKWNVNEINVTINNYKNKNIIEIYGYEDFGIYDENWEDVTEEELKKLSKHIKTTLIISSVGNEKCRYVGASAWIIQTNKVSFVTLNDAINDKLTEIEEKIIHN